MVGKMKSAENAMKSSLKLAGKKDVSYKDGGMSSNVNLPPSFKISKFEEHDGHENSVKYLGGYCNQLRETGGKKNKEDVTVVVVGQQARPRRPRCAYPQSQAKVHTPVLYNHSQNPLYSISPPPYLVYYAQPYVKLPSHSQWRAPNPWSHPPTPKTYQSPSRPDV
ncbi:hypothetical protein FXO38_26091 [Capsicum annuum]|nr:hypothetical protein FXO38_26091 [Capsicum annuum]